jgi:hypothetical protein
MRVRVGEFLGEREHGSGVSCDGGVDEVDVGWYSLELGY